MGTLGDCSALRTADWARIFDAYCAFLFFAWHVCDEAEARAVEAKES